MGANVTESGPKWKKKSRKIDFGTTAKEGKNGRKWEIGLWPFFPLFAVGPKVIFRPFFSHFGPEPDLGSVHGNRGRNPWHFRVAMLPVGESVSESALRCFFSESRHVQRDAEGAYFKGLKCHVM